jgi:hypothetical protein
MDRRGIRKMIRGRKEERLMLYYWVEAWRVLG